jgi:putative queuosine salvage protein
VPSGPPADPLGVRAASREILAEARDVSLGDLGPLVDLLREAPLPGWDRRSHYSGPRLAEYILVLDTVNFSFWGGEGGGYRQLAERLRDAFDAGDPLWSPERLRAVTAGDLRSLLGGFPMLEERAAALRELGAAAGDLTSLIAATAAGTAQNLAGKLRSYDDRPFFKRAQIVPADLWGSGARSFDDLAALTCFADYKLPQLLRHFGAIAYSDRLARLVDGWVELAPGSQEEREIRAATVVAVEALRDQLAAAGRELLAVEVDWLLWNRSQGLFPVRPYHRVRTVFY